MYVLRFGNKLNEEVCRGFIFANLFNSLYLLVRLWWNVVVANLATNFQDLVAKVKNLVALAPVLGAISRFFYPVKANRTYLVLNRYVRVTKLHANERLHFGDKWSRALRLPFEVKGLFSEKALFKELVQPSDSWFW